MDQTARACSFIDTIVVEVRFRNWAATKYDLNDFPELNLFSLYLFVFCKCIDLSKWSKIKTYCNFILKVLVERCNSPGPKISVRTCIIAIKSFFFFSLVCQARLARTHRNTRLHLCFRARTSHTAMSTLLVMLSPRNYRLV